MDQIEVQTGRKFSSVQREIYKTAGGIPGLDGDYTVFGEIISGMDVAEAINSVPTQKTDFPVNPLKFSLSILNKKEIEKLNRLK